MANNENEKVTVQTDYQIIPNNDELKDNLLRKKGDKKYLSPKNTEYSSRKMLQSKTARQFCQDYLGDDEYKAFVDLANKYEVDIDKLIGDDETIFAMLRYTGAVTDPDDEYKLKPDMDKFLKMLKKPNDTSAFVKNMVDKLGIDLDPTVNINSNIEKENGENLQNFTEEANYTKRGQEPCLHNKKSKASVVVRNDGQINLCSDVTTNMKLGSGTIATMAMKSVEAVNSKVIETNDITVNSHRLNPALWEYTDFKEIDLPSKSNVIIGNLTMSGSVLVKAWDHHLNRYVLIRRPCRIPIFGNRLNAPEVNTGLKLEDKYKAKEKILALSSKGYQVNSLIQDAKSRIGKEGIKRNGADAFMAGIAGVSSGLSLEEIGANAISYAKRLMEYGIPKVTACAIVGNINAESKCDPNCYNPNDMGMPSMGLCQWRDDRLENLQVFAKKNGKDVKDASLQIAFLMYELKSSESYALEQTLQCQNVEEATRTFMNTFERPCADPNVNHIAERIAFASELMNKV